MQVWRGVNEKALFSHQGKCLIFSFIFGNSQGKQGRRLCEKQDLVNCVDTRGHGQPQMSGCDAHVSKVSTPEAAQLTHRNTLSGAQDWNMFISHTVSCWCCGLCPCCGVLLFWGWTVRDLQQMSLQKMPTRRMVHPSLCLGGSSSVQPGDMSSWVQRDFSRSEWHLTPL